MSDVMLLGVLEMPPKLWRGDEMDVMQRHARYLQAAQRIREDAAALRELQGEKDAAASALESAQNVRDEAMLRAGEALIELDALKAENADLKTTIHYLRLFGNKDCTAMADAALAARGGMMDELDGLAALVDGVIQQRWPHTIDAQVWASEWAKAIAKNPDMPIDEGAMIGWFANAIMAGYDTACVRAERESRE